MGHHVYVVMRSGPRCGSCNAFREGASYPPQFSAGSQSHKGNLRCELKSPGGKDHSLSLHRHSDTLALLEGTAVARVSLTDIENCGLSAAQTTLQAPGANPGTLGRTEFFTGIADEKNGPGFQAGLCSLQSEHKTTTSVCATENPRLGTPSLCTADWLPLQAGYWRGASSAQTQASDLQLDRCVAQERGCPHSPGHSRACVLKRRFLVSRRAWQVPRPLTEPCVWDSGDSLRGTHASTHDTHRSQAREEQGDSRVCCPQRVSGGLFTCLSQDFS